MCVCLYVCMYAYAYNSLSEDGPKLISQPIHSYGHDCSKIQEQTLAFQTWGVWALDGPRV